MPGGSCAVALCKNTKKKNRDLSFHRFPKDEKLLNEWLVKCRRDKNDVNISHSSVCSQHFGPEMFKEDMRAKVLNLPQKRFLKPGAVPQYRLRGIDDYPRETLRSKRMKLKEEREKHNAIIQAVLSNSSKGNQQPAVRPLAENVDQRSVLHESDSEQTLYKNVIIFREPNSKPLSQPTAPNWPIHVPIYRKNVLLDERRLAPRDHHQHPVTDYRKLYEDLLQRYTAKEREYEEILRKNVELQKILEETERRNSARDDCQDDYLVELM